MNTPISRRTFLKATAWGAASSVSLAAYGRTELQWLEKEKREFFLKNWDRHEFKIAFLADSHLTEQVAVNVTRNAIHWALQQKPDALIFGGDFVEDIDHGVNQYMEPAFAEVRSSGIPAFAVLGNHDYGTADPEQVVHKAEQMGFKVLRNHAAMVGGVIIVGLDCRSFNYTKPEIMDQFKNVTNVISVVHEPDAILEIEPGTAAISLAGHSHGGQVCLPGGIPIHTPLYARKYIEGYYPTANNPLFVTKGLGATGVHIRTFCRPQVHILHLRINY